MEQNVLRIKIASTAQLRDDLQKVGSRAADFAGAWQDVIKPELQVIMRDKAPLVRSSTGKASRLGFAILKKPRAIDPVWSWRRTRAGGRLEMSEWVSEAIAPMLAFTSRDLQRVVDAVARQRQWQR